MNMKLITTRLTNVVSVITLVENVNMLTRWFHTSLVAGVSRRFTSWKCLYLVIIVSSVIFLYASYFCLPTNKTSIISNSDADFRFSSNYLYLPNQTAFPTDFLVYTSNCRIPNVNMLNELHPDFSDKRSAHCENNIRSGVINGLTYVDKQELVINETILETMGLKLTDITCCYRIIERIEQDKNHYNYTADRNFKYSEQCYPITSPRTTPHSGFINVTCDLKRYFRNSPLHNDAHLLAMFEFEPLNSTTLRDKLKFWKDHPHLDRPPNVLLIGIDSTSRNQFHRMLPITTKLLEQNFSAFEMLGYTKVGAKTFPNFVPLLSSYSEEELIKICLPTYWTAQDHCPYIWNKFSSENYLTAHIEDTPFLAIFNHFKTGFVRQPTDIYPRPWMMSVYGNYYGREVKCVDSMTPGQILIRYVEDLIMLAESHRIPYFITTWMTADSHDNVVGARNLDAPLAATLWRLLERGLLNNTVLFVMSDHGYRYHESRRTLAGWYEDKLPALLITLPTSARRTFPVWVDNLRHNSRQLSTPFDVHATLKHILGKNTPIRAAKGGIRGVSLFEKLPSRSCNEAGIPIEFCACSLLPTDFNISSNIIRLAAGSLVRKINAMPPSTNCSVLRLGKITAFADIGESEATVNCKLVDSRKFIIAIETTPGKIDAEGIVGFNATSYDFEVIGLIQTSSSVLNDNRHCLPDTASREWCECKEKKKRWYNCCW